MWEGRKSQETDLIDTLIGLVGIDPSKQTAETDIVDSFGEAEAEAEKEGDIEVEVQGEVEAEVEIIGGNTEGIEVEVEVILEGDDQCILKSTMITINI